MMIAKLETNVNPHLVDVYEKTLELFRNDPRVPAAYLSGSVGAANEDAYSDVDPVLVIRDRDFDAFDAELPRFFSAAGAEPILWWPERCNGPALRNYAVFFVIDGALVQYDITIERLAENQVKAVPAGRILFDKGHVLRGVEPAAAFNYSPERLGWRIEMYWIYVYIHCKYLNRGDVFRLLAAQQELFTAHLEALHALQPEIRPDWWPLIANQLADADKKAALLAYWGHRDAASVADALPGEVERFSRDARAACHAHNVPYPAAFEEQVLRYLSGTLRGLGHAPASG